jgi:glycosyltransferase involved in cell wall biosynthesis
VHAGLEQAGDVTVFAYSRDRGILARAASVLGRSPLGAVARRVPVLGGVSFAGAHREFASLEAQDWDVAWFAHHSDVSQIGPIRSCPSVADFPRIESYVIEQELSAKRGGRSRILRRNRDRWARLEREVLHQVTIGTVCHELDRRRLAAPNVRVLPMGYPLPTRPAGHGQVRTPPTILHAGSLHLEQNSDAARHLASTLLPQIRREIPGATVRIVGAAPRPIARELGRYPGVVLTGFVERMETELEQADLVVAPLRYGGGTHVKVLEAFAHRVPVVSTTLGIDGIAAANGVHAMVADGDEFAPACVRVLRDETLRSTLVENAQALLEERYGTDVVEARVAAIATDLANS